MSRVQDLLKLFGLQTKLVGQRKGQVSRSYLQVLFQVVNLPAQYVVILAELFLYASSLPLILLDLGPHCLYLLLELAVHLAHRLRLLHVLLVLFGRPVLAIALLGFHYRLELLLRGLYAQLGLQVCQPLLMQAAEGIDLRLQDHIHLGHLLE